MTVSFIDRIRRFFSGPRRIAGSAALVALVLSLFVWQWVGNWYETQQLADKRSAVTAELTPYGNALSAAINGRFALLHGLQSYTESHIGILTEHSETVLDIFAAGLYASAPGIRTLTISPDGVHKYVYPLEGNETVLGHDLINDERPNVRADVQRAIATGIIALSGPYELRQGGLGLVARQAVYQDGDFWGLVAMVLDMPPVLAEAGLDDESANLSFALRDGAGTVFWGDAALFEDNPVNYTVALPEGAWELAAVPVGGWTVKATNSVWLVRGGGLLMVLLLTALTYLVVNRQTRLDDAIAQKKRELADSFQALQVSEARYRGVVEDTPVLITSFLPDGEITFVNEAYCQYHAGTLEELVGSNFLALIPKDDRETVMADISALTVESPTQTYSHRVVAPGGDIRWQRWVNRALFDAQGQVAAYQSIGEDITERRQTQEALRESETRYRTLFDHASDAILISDLQRNVLDANQLACHQLGYSRPELLSIKLDDFVASDHVDNGQKHFSLLAESGHVVFETAHVHQNGRIIPIELSATMIEFGGETAVLGIARDMTDRRKMQAALRESEARYRSIVEDLPGLICSFQPGGTIIFVNDAYCQYFNQEREALVGQNFSALIPESDREMVMANIASLTMDAPLLTHEHQVIAPGGEKRWQRWTNRGLFDENGQIMGYQSFGEDVTEKKLAQTALQESNARMESIFLVAPVGIGVVANRVFLRVNELFCEMVGYSQDELVGQNARMVYPTDEDYEFVGKAKYAQIQERNIGTVETRFLRKDGRIIDVLLSSTPIDSDDLTVGVTFTALDITERKETEAALQESERNLRILVDNSADVIWQTDLRLKFTYVNPAIYNMIGYTQEEWIGSKVSQHTTRLEFFKMARKALGAIKNYKKFKSVLFETNFLKKNGENLPVEIVGKLILNEKGIPIGLQGATRDITERKQTEAAFMESEERYRNLVEMSPDGIILHRDEIFIYANAAAARIVGAKSPDSLLGKPVHKFVHPDYWGKTSRRGDRMIAGERGLYPAEDVYLRLDGTAVPVEVSAAVLTYQGETAVQLIFRDISERKAADVAVQQRAAQLAVLNEIGSQITAVLDLDSVLERAANLLQEKFGYHHVALFLIDREQNEIVLHARAGYFDALVPLVHRLEWGTGLVGWVAQHNKTLLTNDVSVEPRYLSLIPDDAATQAELTVPIQVGAESIGVLDIQSPQRDAFDENDVTALETLAAQLAVAVENARLHAIERDHVAALETRVQARTTELQQRVVEVEQLNSGMLNLLTDLQSANASVTRTAQQLEETNTELESFAYSVSHDLRAPLRHVSGFVTMLQKREDGRLDEKSAHYLQVITEAAARMGQLIDDLLAFSRTGRQELFTQPVDVNKLVADARRELAPDIKNRNIIWEIDTLPTVTADPALLRQVWANLLGNAVKYTAPRQKARIEIGALPPDENDEITFFIRDNGVGFDEQYTDKLFGVFQRLHRDDEFEGTGIGLATARRIIYRHNGRIWAEGEVDKGATFYFTLPNNISS